MAGLCRTDPPKEAAKCLELVDGILEAGRLRRGIAESHALTAALFPGMNLGDRSESYREFAQATRWFVDLHAEKAAGTVDETIHDMLDHRPVQSEVNSESRKCREAMQKIRAALEDVSEAIQLRNDRSTPGISFWIGPTRISGAGWSRLRCTFRP